MSLSQLINRPCTLHRPTGATAADAYGNENQGTVSVETVCELQQKRRDEPDDQGETSDTQWSVYFLPGTTVTTEDSLTVGGSTYEFVGHPWVARNPRTKVESHIEGTLRRTAGSDDEGGA